MSTMKTSLSGLAILLVLLSLTACASATQPAPTPTTQPPTATATVPVPTSTSAPTEVPPTLKADVTQSSQTATASANPSGGSTGSGTTANTTPSATKAAANPQPAAGGSAPADHYQYITQSLADHSQLRPGVTVSITWAVKNTGTSGWTTGYALRYFSGIKAAKDSYAFPKTIAPGETANLTITFTTPDTPGDYNTWWKLTNANLQNFGDVDFTFTVTNTPTKATSTPAK